jgi:hypothetical protein
MERLKSNPCSGSLVINYFSRKPRSSIIGISSQNAFLFLFFTINIASANVAVLSKQAAHSLGSVSMPCFCRNTVISDYTHNSLFDSTIL